MALTINGTEIETDPEGYLANLEDWTPEVAELLARQDNLTLEDNHWRIINFLREYKDEYGVSPNLRFIQKGLKELYGDEWGDKKFLFDLFPQSPAKQGNRISGGFKPTGCV